jgi:hypothetical protein
VPSRAINFDTVLTIGFGFGVARRGGECSLRVVRAQGSGETLGVRALSLFRRAGFFVIRLGFDDCAEPLAAAPDVYYATDHYLGYSAVLLRLSRFTPDVLRHLLVMAHQFVTAHQARGSPNRNRPKPVRFRQKE